METVTLYREVGKTLRSLGAYRVVLLNSKVTLQQNVKMSMEVAVDGAIDIKAAENFRLPASLEATEDLNLMEEKMMIPISDIIIRSISGYLFIVPVIILYHLFLGRKNKEQTVLHIIAMFVFCYYLFGILTVTGIGFTKSVIFSPNLSFVPKFCSQL